MSVAEIKNNALELTATKMASLQESIKEIDWKGHAMTFVNFGKEKAIDIYKTAKDKSTWEGFKKAYKLAEYVPILNWYTGMGRLAWAAAYGTKVTVASWTTRPFKYGIAGTFKKYWMEEIPYILKQFARGAFTVYLTGKFVETQGHRSLLNSGFLWNTGAALANYGYDVVTNNIEALKNNRFIPNYWA